MEVLMHKKLIFSFLIVCLVGSASLFAADLRIGPSILFNPTNFYAGDNVSISTGIISVGGVTKNARIIVKMGNTVIYNQVYPEFAANNALAISVNWVATVGTHTVKFKIDNVDPTTPDTTTSNNEVSKTFTVNAQLTTTADTKKLGRKSNSIAILSTNKPGLCTEHQNDPTDLAVSDFHVTTHSATQWKITAKIKNQGQRCLKVLKWEVKNLGHLVAQKIEGSPTNPGWLLQANDEISVQKIVNSDPNPPTFPSGNLTMTRFTFTVDPNHNIPDTNPSNNSVTFDMVLP
jgi:hypothetical protein